MEEQIEKTKKEVRELYDMLYKVANSNPKIYIMPTEVYNAILKKLGHIEDRIKKQTKSLYKHLKDKREMATMIKELKASNTENASLSKQETSK